MAFMDCIATIRAAAGKNLTDAEIDSLVEQVQKRAQYLKARGIAADAQAAALQAADDVGNRMRQTVVIEARNAAINAAKRIELGAWARTHYTGNPTEAMEAILVGVNRVRQGARNSAAAVRKSTSDHYVGGITADLHATGLIKVFAKGVLDRPIARALWALSRKDARAIERLPKESVTLAKAIAKWQEFARVEANKAGAWIGERAGYIVTQSHDTLKILRAGFEKWKTDVLPKLDVDAMFAQSGERDVNSMLEGFYRELTGGVQHTAPKGELAGFKGPDNLAQRMSQSRELLFKDADSWMDYNEKYGSGNLREAVIGGLRARGEATGLMRVLGTNPESMVDTLMADLLAAHDHDDKARRALKQSTARLAKYLRAIDGSMDTPANDMYARIGANTRALESMSKLGRALLSQFSDIPNYASELRYQGRGFLSGMGEAIGGLFTNFKQQDRLELLSSLGVFFDSLSGEMARTGSLEDPGTLTKATRTFYKLNLMQWWSEKLRGAAGTGMSHFMAQQTRRAWESLSPDFRRVLGQYNIDGGKWDLIRRSAVKHIDGNGYVVPEGIRDVDHNVFAEYLHGRGQNVSAGTVGALRDEIEHDLRNYFTDRVSYAVVEPDAKTRATMLMGTQRGTSEGELLRFMMQFKSFNGAYVQKVMGRELYGRGYEGKSIWGAALNGNGELAGIANIILATTLFGYGSMTAKSLAKGQAPRDPEDPATWVAAMAQGGGAGIYGDFLFGEASRFGGGFIETLGGPTAGTVGGLIDLWQRVREGDDVAARTFKFALDNTPFLNLGYIRPVLDYAILYQIQESLNPGFTRRIEANARKNGTEFLLKPSAFAH